MMTTTMRSSSSKLSWDLERGVSNLKEIISEQSLERDGGGVMGG